MRVLMINSVCGIRSTGRICTDIADMLIKNGDECKIGYGRESVPAKYNEISVRIGNKLDVYNHVMLSRIFDKSGYGSKKTTKKFLKWVDKYNPDVIHLHNIHGYYINIKELFLYLKKVKKPIVWTFHDCWPFTGHCTYFDFAKCSSWKNKLCAGCMRKKSYPSSFLFSRSKKNFLEKRELFSHLENMTIVTPSSWLSGLVKESFLGEYNVKVIRNGIDLSAFKPNIDKNDFRNKYGIKDKIVLLGVASSWGYRKGIDDFKKINEIKTENEVVVMVGLTEEQLANLPEGIVGITRTNNLQELVDIYSSADVFLNPTYEDNYPTVNLEAQACGTPVVTYRTGGSVESVPSDHIVEVGDVVGLLEKAREVIRNSKIEDVSNFSREKCFMNYIELYNTLVNN